MSRDSTTLYVTGFGSGTRARDLAYEFERYGPLVRCDIPAPRSASSRLFAFVEYKHREDADEAYHDMHNRSISRDERLKIEWARTPPSANWRFEPGASRPPRRERSPRRSGRSATPPRRSTRDDSRDRYRDRERERDDGRSERRDRYRSRSPEPRKDRDRDDDKSRRDRYRSRTPEVRDKESKEAAREPKQENGANGAEHADAPAAAADLDTAE